MNLRDRITEILSPAIDPRAPYAKVMIGELVKLVALSPDVGSVIDGANAALAKDLAATPFEDLRDIIERLIEIVERQRRWIADLQSGLYVNCVYCGHRYGPGEMTPVAMADALKAHVVQCPEHPMSGLVKACEAAWHALKSYECGNASPELAQDIAARVYQALTRVRGQA